MRTIIVLLAAAILFIACGKDKSEGTTETKKEQSVENKSDTSKSQGSQSKDTKPGETKPAGGIEDLTYDVSDIPANIKYSGSIVGGAKWKDNNGSNVLIITETKVKNKKTDDQGFTPREKELYGYHFITGTNESKQLWMTQDFVKDCELDLTLDYIKKSLSITDINKNGIAESTFMYFMACTGDVSPNDMKLLMHEGEKKYAIRGTALLKMQGKTYGGEMKVDKSFDDAPSGFLDYAKGEWKKFGDQKSGE